MTAKTTSAHHNKFVTKFGHNTWEVEALPPDQLQEILDEAVQGVIDLDAFERECQSERADAHRLEGVRRTIYKSLQRTEFSVDDEGTTTRRKQCDERRFQARFFLTGTRAIRPYRDHKSARACEKKICSRH
jgi:hypothetical protein